MSPELAALIATAISVVGVAPQLRRVLVGGDAAGISVTSAAIGISTEIAWVGYGVSSELWTAIPEPVLMLANNVVLLAGTARLGVRLRTAAPVGVAWLAVLGGVAAVGGRLTLAPLLAAAYALQSAPAVWTVWRTRSPSGVASLTWLVIGVEGALWGFYGLHHHDPATTWFGAIAIVASTATLARKLAVRLARTGPQAMTGDAAGVVL